MPIGSSGDVLACTYPRPIRQAQARAALIQDLWSSPLLRLVQTLIAFTPIAAPRAPLVFRREVPAKALDVSTRTVDRLLGQLAQLGFIQRLKQERFGRGSWGCTRVSWTDKAYSEIFTARHTPPSKDATLPCPVDMIVDSPDQQSSIHRATAVAHKSEVFVLTECSKNGSSENSQPKRRLPDDLATLSSGLGLSVRALCALMAAAKSAKQRLQHVLAVKADYMKQQAIVGARAYRYLLACINSGNDFQWQATQQQRLAEEKRSADSRQVLFAKCRKQLSAGRFTLPDGREILGTQGDFVEISAGRVLGSLPVSRLLHDLAVTAPDWLHGLADGRIRPRVLAVRAGDRVAAPPRLTPAPKTGGPRSDNADEIRARFAAARRLLGMRAR